MAKKSNRVKQEPTIDDIIDKIKQKSADGDYIYRGERKRHRKISSAFYRECAKIDSEHFDLRDAQKEMLDTAKKHTAKSPIGLLADYLDIKDRKNAWLHSFNRDIKTAFENAAEREILIELQHYGGKTNLIDFTTDYLIAIFFACSGYPKNHGRIILLDINEAKEKDMIIHPQNPQHRVIAQKSVFVDPPEGFIEVPKDKKVTIPSALKQEFLTYLRKHHGISTETIYNDIHGFITYQNIHENYYIAFYMGLTFQSRGFNAETKEKRQKEYKEAIKHYSTSIEVNPHPVPIINRADCWLYLEEWDKAKDEFNTAIEMGWEISTIIELFRNNYENVAAFEEKTGSKMPEDLAEMLGG